MTAKDKVKHNLLSIKDLPEACPPFITFLSLALSLVLHHESPVSFVHRTRKIYLSFDSCCLPDLRTQSSVGGGAIVVDGSGGVGGVDVY
ncbi:hypothetical protein E2C01_009550 [Portunus trituberculatus]|uniref:Uncharacterized protein n=1 Tax=Portunus trituberculatus TaxID=210409 RepID=A0A5B7D634_PORTR|nr:hypothetical protein [Portunus trituberculatus]